MNFSKTQRIIIGVAVFVVIFLILLFTGLIPGLTQNKPVASSLVVMGFEDRRVFDPLITSFRTKFPEVEVDYQQVDITNYEQVLLNRLAAGTGPDIFMFNNTWLPKHYNKITPVSEDQLPFSQFQNLFPTVVVQDFAPTNVIYALPLYIDTLALYYNKDAFDSAGIALPPRNWLEFQNNILQLRKKDRFGNLTQPAAAIGGSARNIQRASDLLSLMFLQSGTQMTNSEFSRATFSADGLGALNFYLSYADPTNEFYTWNSNQQNSLDLFASGRLPMMFHYRYEGPILKNSAPFLNFAVAPMPQPSSAGPKVTYADYYGLAVSSASRNQRVAWDFIINATTDPNTNQLYLQATGEPPALRSLINLYQNDPELGVFAQQALTARSWPQIDNRAVEQSFNKMIDNVLSGSLSADQAIRQSENEITQLMGRRF